MNSGPSLNRDLTQQRLIPFLQKIPGTGMASKDATDPQGETSGFKAIAKKIRGYYIKAVLDIGQF